MIYTYQHKGKTYTLNLEPQPDGGYRVTIGRIDDAERSVAERSYLVRARSTPGGWLLEIDGQHSFVYTVSQGNRRYLHLNGRNHILTVPDARPSPRKAAGVDGEAGSLRAQMPGQVVNVLVGAGDAVQKGQTLMILEAMKMEIRVAAPGDGVVKRLLVAKGDVVERGQLLVEIGNRG